MRTDLTAQPNSEKAIPLGQSLKRLLKRQRWLMWVLAKPRAWRARRLEAEDARRRSVYDSVVLDGVLTLRPSNFKSRFCISAKSHVAQRIVLEGAYEPEISDAIRAVWRGPGSVVNVGANVGFWAVEIFNLCPDVDKVYAVEPNPEAFELLQRNTELNGLTGRIIPIQACVSDVEGDVEFEMVEGKPEYSSIGGIAHPAVLTSKKRVARIRAKPLGELIDLKANIKLLIVDTEGADYLVLRGARDFIAKERPTIIFETCETMLQKFGHSVRDIRTMLEDMQYVVRKALNLSEPVPDGYDWQEAIAIPQEHLPKA